MIYNVGQDIADEELLPNLENYTHQIVAARRMGLSSTTVLTSDHRFPREVYLNGFARRVTRYTPADIFPAKEPLCRTCGSATIPPCNVLLTNPHAPTATAQI